MEASKVKVWTCAFVAILLTGCLLLPKPKDTELAVRGEIAPEFRLARTGMTPGELTLKELRTKGKTVLVFYRGDW
jgi:hypothetical protein